MCVVRGFCLSLITPASGREMKGNAHNYVHFDCLSCRPNRKLNFIREPKRKRGNPTGPTASLIGKVQERSAIGTRISQLTGERARKEELLVNVGAGEVLS